jgi:hypothetical protein
MLQLSADSVISIAPQVASDGQRVHVIWFGLDTIGNARFSGIQYARSLDSGKSFEPPRTILPPDVAFSPGYLACAGNSVFVASLGMLNGRLGIVFAQSSDGGSTWSTPIIIQENRAPRFILAGDSLLYIHFGALGINRYGLLKRNTSGGPWTAVNTNMSALDEMVLNGNTLHGVGNPLLGVHTEVTYYYSTNSGATWLSPEIVSPEDAISSMYPRLTVGPDDTRYLIWIENGNLILRQSNGYDDEGLLQWKPQRTITEGTNAVFTDIAMQGNMISVIWEEQTSDTTVIRNFSSPNKGKAFCPATAPSDGLRAGEASSMMVGSKIHIVWSEERNSNREIYYRQRQITEIQIPPASALIQNYPNPVEGSTYIKYELPSATRVTLSVYNVLGQRIAILVDQFQDEGRYTVEWNAPHIASGVYFYRLNTSTFSGTKKLIKLR